MDPGDHFSPCILADVRYVLIAVLGKLLHLCRPDYYESAVLSG